MKKSLFKSLIFTILSAFFLTFPVPVCAKSLSIPEDVHYILIDSKTGLVMAEQNADIQIKPASLTKILTAIVALENGDLQREMTVSQAAVNDIGKGGMNIGIMAGETGLTLENMLNVMLIKSANETANIIAENLAPSRSEYMDMMNEKAREIGALNTYYVNPSGKDTEKEDAPHVTTARDMAVMARYAMTIPEFRKIVATEYYYGMPSSTNKHADGWDPLVLRNTNKFLWYDNTYNYTFEGDEREYTVTGIKTGYTGAAGNNLVISATDEDGMELICVVMHVMHSNKVYSYASELLDYGFQNYSLKKVSNAGQLVKTVIVDGAAGDDNILELVTEAGFEAVLPVGSDSQDIETRVEIDSEIAAPVQKGKVLGYIEYMNSGTVLGKVNIVAARQVLKSAEETLGITSALAEEQEPPYSYAILAVLLALCAFVIIRSVLKKISRNIKKKKYEQEVYRSR
jgi:D-alanyl-D-alanine carboxypeptidase/D-alanyl-D-alanine carboxypeptidase (penicillin-binding protein 5/6)